MRHPYSTLALLGLFFTGMLISISGCASGPPVAPPPGCVSFVGTWNTDAGPVEFVQTGCYMTGTFPSPLRSHAIRGTVYGNRLRFDWKGPLGSGRGIVTMNDTGSALAGTFGYGPETSDGRFSGTRGAWPGK